MNLEGASVWAGRTVSNTRNGMDAHGWSTQPPAPSFQQAGSPEPLAGGISDEMLKPVLEGLGNQTNACKKKPPQRLGVKIQGWLGGLPVCVAGDLLGRTPQLPAEAISVSHQRLGRALCGDSGLLSPIHPLPAGSISISTPAVRALRGAGSQMGNEPFTIDFWLGNSLRSPVLHSRLPGTRR